LRCANFAFTRAAAWLQNASLRNAGTDFDLVVVTKLRRIANRLSTIGQYFACLNDHSKKSGAKNE